MTSREPTLCCFSAPPVSAKTSWAAAVQAQRGSEYCEKHGDTSDHRYGYCPGCKSHPAAHIHVQQLGAEVQV